MNRQRVRYLIRKVLGILLTLFTVTLLSFLLMRLSPVDPAMAYVKRHCAVVTQQQLEAARIELGLNKPLLLQYVNWVKDAFSLKFGISLGTGQPVISELEKTFLVTLTVVGSCALIMSVGILLFGACCYFFRNTFMSRVLSFLSSIGISFPAFYLATVFLDVFAVRFGWINVTGNRGLDKYLPAALCLSVSGICFYGQMLSSSLEREMRQDYTMYASYRGLSEIRILLFHALPHILVDLLPSFAQMLGLCMAGAAIVERVFSLSGLGYLIIDSVVKRDAPVIHAAVLLLAVVLVLLDTVADFVQYLLKKESKTKEMVS